MNALTLLKQDHNNVDSLFSDFEQYDPADGPGRRRIVDHIVEQLSVHAAIEEMVLYPAVRTKASDSTPDVLEALEEHHIVKWTLSELESMDPDAERFEAKVKVLIESVRHHVQEEEDVLFAHLREAFTNRELEALGQQLEEAKRTAPTRPHPRVPDIPPLNTLIGLPVALLDRAVATGRDAVERVLHRSA